MSHWPAWPTEENTMTPTFQSVRKWAVQTARLCCGVPDYDVYARHLREHHPERKVPSYAEFFRERQTARYKSGGGRCC
jgi:uncharacterized short protein YbdD (DUF466 family)